MARVMAVPFLQGRLFQSPNMQRSLLIKPIQFSLKVRPTSTDQNTGGALLEFSMRTAVDGTSRVPSAISVYKISQ